MYSSKEREIVMCPRCKGVGLVSWEERVTSERTETYYKVCPTCNGHRVMRKIVETNYEPVSQENVDLEKLLKER